MTLWRALVLSVCASISWSSPAGRPGHTLHLHLSPRELRDTFSVARHDDVPEYDLFHVRSVRRRSLRHRRSVHVRAFGNAIDLDLHANHEIHNEIRLFYADAPPGGGGVTIERVRGDTDLHVGQLYQDVRHKAALLVDHSGDTLQMNGLVDDLVIAPAPLRVHHYYPAPNDDDMMLMEEEVGDLDVMNGTFHTRRKREVKVTRGLHVVFRRRDQPGQAGAGLLDLSDDAAYLEPEPGSGSGSGPQNPGRRRREAGDLYPEILVIVDYETFGVHNYDPRTAKKYIMSFMNAIDLLYKEVTYPAIIIKVAGIVISKSKEATPYLEENVLHSRYLDAVASLGSIGRYLYTEHRLPSYDAALVMTKRDMCTRNRHWGTCNKVTAGYAYVGGGCSISKYFSKINSVALIEDSGGFSGIVVGTHELGHLMGAVHDGSPPASYLGGPGALTCDWEDGYIMSDLRRDFKGLKWSVCSLDQFGHFSRDRRSTCMRNYPAKRLHSRLLPGKLISVDAQCKRDRGTSACFKDHRICTELYCFEPSSGYCVSFRPAAEGSRCGEGMQCISGFCEPEAYHF